MPKISHIDSVQMLVRILRLVNDLAPAETGGIGEPIPLGEFAARLDMEQDDVLLCIEKINDGCGDTAPEMIVLYDPDSCTVTPLRIETAFARPLRLTAAEARGLVAAAEAAGYDGADLAEKIEGAFPSLDDARLLDIRTAVGASPDHATITSLTAAARERRVLRISYKSPNDTEPRARIIEPARVDYDDEAGAWYVVAWCRSSCGWRTFRVDRIVDLTETGEACNPHADEDSDPETFSFSKATTAVLAIRDPQSVSEAYDWRGLVRATQPDPFDQGRLTADEVAAGGYIAHIPWIEGSPWLARSIVRTMGGVEVLRPVRLREEVRNLARTLQTKLSGFRNRS